MPHRSVGATLLAAAMLLLPALVGAHELFLRPDSFFLKPHSKELLKLVNGTFDQSLATFARNRMTEVSIAAEGRVTHPPASDWYDAGTATYLNFTTGAAGTYVAGVSTRAGSRTQTAAEFREFLRIYGVQDGLASFDANNKLAAVRHRLSKHVKAVVQVGDGPGSEHATRLGHPVEIVPTRNPYRLGPDEAFTFQILHQGRPVANQLVHASHAGFNEDDNAPKRINALHLRTDAHGVASFKPDRKSAWYVTVIHLQPMNDGTLDFESTWATLAFETK